MMVNGQPTNLFCITSGTAIHWSLADSSVSFADMRFDPSATPFSKSSLVADANNDVGEAPSATTQSCYNFTITDCPVVSGSCGRADPKVVVNPPGFNKPNAQGKATPPKSQP